MTRAEKARSVGGLVFRLSAGASLGCAIFLSACAAANVQPVHMVQPGDEALSCSALKQEIDKNSAAAQKFLERDHQVEQANTAKVMGSAIPYLGILVFASSDLSNKEQVEARALIDRDQHLEFLSKQKNCQ